MQQEVFEALLRNALPKGKESDDAETRKAAVRSLMQAVKTIGMERMPVGVLKDCLEVCYRALNDY